MSSLWFKPHVVLLALIVAGCLAFISMVGR